jgi:6-phosphofructokinase 1
VSDSSSVERFKIASLGPAKVKSPIILARKRGYVSDNERLLYRPHRSLTDARLSGGSGDEAFQIAGPREFIYFRPSDSRAAIVTCGGLCPGLNAVIRGLVNQLWYRYEVRSVLGFRYGYQGMSYKPSDEPIELTPKLVESIHQLGGTVLGSSRGTPPTSELVDSLVHHRINMLFTIGGDGTMRGASAIVDEIKRRGLEIAVVGIPKTIDNDIPFVRRSFGFETAVAEACKAVHAAHEEARGAKNGVGLVKLMGRHSGYIAANTTLATGHVNFCLIPEIKFELEGESGLFALLERRLKESGHAVIAVAEGAGQQFFSEESVDKDLSGNIRLSDIGVFLRDQIGRHMKAKLDHFSLKYIDPSYMIRSTPANPSDMLFCFRMAQNAVHAAMAGKTGILIGYWHGEMTHVPLTALVGNSQRVNPEGELWFNVIETTGQPLTIGREN